MVYGGCRARQSVEIINLIDFKLRFEFLTDEMIIFPVGGVIDEKVVIFNNCYYQNPDQKCIVLGEPNKTIEMIGGRFDSAIVELNENALLILGGATSPQNSTEIIKFDQLPVNGPDLGPDFPFDIKRHSMVKVNPKAIYIIGGTCNIGGYKNFPDKTWIMDPTDNFKLKEGPSMIDMRGAGANISAKMMLNGKICIVTMHSYYVAILDTTSSCWKQG